MPTATEQHTTNVVPITSARRRRQERVPPESGDTRLTRTPELAIILSMLCAMPRGQREKVKDFLGLVADQHRGDMALQDAYDAVRKVM